LREVEGLEQHELRDRVAEVTIGLLEQQAISEFVFVAQEREIIFAATFTFEFSRIGIEHPCLPDIVEREIRVREFFLEFGVSGHHFYHALTQDQRVVAEACDVREECDFLIQRFSTPSGMS
jgi:hypothetical protein